MARNRTKNLIIPDKVKQPSGLKKDGTPNAYWRRFEKRLTEFENVPIDQWKPEEVLAYLLKRYGDHYQIDFSLSYYGPPTKCPEIYCVRRMMTVVGTEEGPIIKQYIDWVFDTIIIPKKTKVTSLAFFFTYDICRKFKVHFHKINNITKTTELPDRYREVVKELEFDSLINTYGDLAFVKMALDNDPITHAHYGLMFEKLHNVGLNVVMLKHLED